MLGVDLSVGVMVTSVIVLVASLLYVVGLVISFERNRRIEAADLKQVFERLLLDLRERR